MRFIYTITLASLIFFFGCDQGTDITNPENLPSTPSQLTSNHPYQLIKLPPKKGGIGVETIFSETKKIKGDKGGEIKIHEQYEAEDGHKVKVEVKAKFEKYAFEGDVEMTLIVDDEFAAVSFFPEMEFKYTCRTWC